jgi:hypothetical protein
VNTLKRTILSLLALTVLQGRSTEAAEPQQMITETTALLLFGFANHARPAVIRVGSLGLWMGNISYGIALASWLPSLAFVALPLSVGAWLMLRFHTARAAWVYVVLPIIFLAGRMAYEQMG